MSTSTKSTCEIQTGLSSSKFANYDWSHSTLIVKIVNVSNRRLLLELSICSTIVIASFVLALIHFLNESIQTVVPTGFTSGCSDFSEIYTLAQQVVNVSIPSTVEFMDTRTGTLYPILALATFFASWTSCGIEHISGITLQDDSNTQYNPYFVELEDSKNYSFSSFVNSNNDCFHLSCGYHYTIVADFIQRTDLAEYLNNSLNLVVPTNLRYSGDDVNGTFYVTNGQVVSSITATTESVTGYCAVTMGGLDIIPLTIGNSVAQTGSFLCTKYTSKVQALSSSLSIALSAIGICRLYFAFKRVSFT